MMKMAIRNNLLKKVANSKWVQMKVQSEQQYDLMQLSRRICSTSMGQISTRTHAELNKLCRAITGCQKPTYVEELYLLNGIASPYIKRSTCTRMKRTKQVSNEEHSLFGHFQPINASSPATILYY